MKRGRNEIMKNDCDTRFKVSGRVETLSARYIFSGTDKIGSCSQWYLQIMADALRNRWKNIKYTQNNEKQPFPLYIEMTVF